MTVVLHVGIFRLPRSGTSLALHPRVFCGGNVECASSQQTPWCSGPLAAHTNVCVLNCLMVLLVMSSPVLHDWHDQLSKQFSHGMHTIGSGAPSPLKCGYNQYSQNGSYPDCTYHK